MKQTLRAEEHIIGILQEHEAGAKYAVSTTCRKIRSVLGRRSIPGWRCGRPNDWSCCTLTEIVNGHKQWQIDDLLPWNHTAKVW